MDLAGRSVVVTGGGSGIGAALAQRAVAEGASDVVVVDRDEVAAMAVAEAIGARPVVADLGSEDGVAAAIEVTGVPDIWMSNAGVAVSGDVFADEASWDVSWRVNVMAGVRAARALVPTWVERGEGAFVSTVSASGLLNHLFSAPYAATKAAALSFAENLAMSHGDAGIRVLAVCPLGVRTPMLAQDTSGHLDDEAIEPDDVAAAVVAALAQDRQFLVLPHEQVRGYSAMRGAEHDRWIGGMQRLRREVVEAAGGDVSWG